MARSSEPPDPQGDEAATALMVRRPPKRRPLGVLLRVLGAEATPAVYRLTHGRCTVGSGPGNDIVISEKTVSRSHLEIELVPEGIAVTDLGSTNGTFYLGQRLQKLILAMGGRLTVGGAAMLAIEADTEALEEGLDYPHEEYRGIVGRSLAMRRIFATLTRLEGSLVTVLVEGQSGVGKELIARALHEGSKVAGGPFVTVNCGAIPRDLVASELFGHRRGAFTGALEARRGAFETADGGTVFLDEIGELPIDVQPMLLRALEAGEVRPVGSDQAKVVKVRVITATNRNLESEVQAGRFREDLFYRVAVVRIHVPPLAERSEDIELLARRFAEHVGLTDIPQDVIDRLKARPWSGNARELRNAVQVYAALGALPEPSRSKSALLRLVLAEQVDMERPYAHQKEEINDLFTRLYLEQLLAHTAGNRTVAARVAGLDRTYLSRLLGKYGMPKG